MQQPKSKFWIVNGPPSSINNIDTQSLRLQIPHVNWVNVAKIKENTFILCFRFSVQLSFEEVCDKLTGIFSDEDFNFENNLHIAETVHTTPEQKNIYICHLPKFLHDEKKLRTLVNSFVKKVTVIDNCEYMTIRCQSCQNSSLAATFLRSIPAECLTEDYFSSNGKSNSQKDSSTNDINRICFGRKLTVELSVSMLPIALLFKVNKDIIDYDNGIPILAELRKSGAVSKDFTVTKSHINSPCMQVLAITASSISEIDCIIEKLSDSGFNAKRCLSVPRQEEIEKSEIIIENVQQKTIHELRKRIKDEFYAPIYEARIISTNTNSSENNDSSNESVGERNDALIIFYDNEDANKVVQRLQNGKEHARFYRTTALLHNLPIDITADEVKDYIAHLTLKNENAEFASQIDLIDICIHQYSFNKVQFKQQIDNSADFEGGSYAEIKFPSIEYMQKFVKCCSILDNKNDERIEKITFLRGVFIPFASETKRGRYKREVFYEKTINSIVKENTIRVVGCTTNEAFSIISKGGFPILYFGQIEDENKCQKMISSSKKVPNVSARAKALMMLSGALKNEEIPSNSNNSNDNNKISIVFNNNRHNSTNNEDNNVHFDNTLVLLPELLISFCSKEDMRKAADGFKSKGFGCEEFDFTVLQMNNNTCNDGDDDNTTSNNTNINGENGTKKLVNPFIVERDDGMKFINEPAPQQQQQQKMAQRTTMSTHSNHHIMRSTQKASSKFNQKHLFIQKNESPPISHLPPPKISKANSNS